mgnify:CR=1 FL=1
MDIEIESEPEKKQEKKKYSIWTTVGAVALTILALIVGFVLFASILVIAAFIGVIILIAVIPWMLYMNWKYKKKFGRK